MAMYMVPYSRELTNSSWLHRNYESGTSEKLKCEVVNLFTYINRTCVTFCFQIRVLVRYLTYYSFDTHHSQMNRTRICITYISRGLV